MVLAKPELAKSQHKYGNGCKSVKEGAQYCINPDLSETGRRENFEARQNRRERTKRSTDGQD